MRGRFPNIRPKRYWWTALLSAITIGGIIALLGLIFWIKSGFTSIDALICIVAGLVVFFGFLYVKSLDKEYEEKDPERENGGAP